MKHTTRGLLFSAAISLIVSSPVAQADVIAGYDFSAEATGAVSSAATISDANANVGDYTTGAGMTYVIVDFIGDTSGVDADGVAFGTAGTTDLGNFSHTNASVKAASHTDAITNDDYMTFTVTPQSGYAVNLSSITFKASPSNATKSARQFAVHSSIGGFTDADEISLGTIAGSPTGDTITYQSFSFLLADSSFQNITTATEFRIYLWGGSGTAGGSRTSFDKVVLNGSVTTGPPTWQTDGNGDWSTLANWDPSVPNAASAEAIFNDALLTGPLTANLDAAVTLGDLSLNSAQAITISGANALTFDGGGAASVSASAGSHLISSAVSLTDSLDVALSPGSALDIGGALSGTTTVTNSGDGQLTLSGDLSGHTGSIISDAGTLVVSGTGSSAITANAGVLEVSGTGSSDITVNAGATLRGEGSHTGTLNLAADSILSVDPTNGASAFTTGTLSPTAPVNVDFSSSPVGLGTFTVLNYTTYAGTAATDFVNPDYRITFANTTTSITATVAAAESSNWTAADDDNGFFYWDNGVSTNWSSADLLFFGEDSVTFTDTGVGFVDVAAEVAPSTVTFTNTIGTIYTVEDGTANVETISATTGGINVTGDGDVVLNVKVTGNTDITHSGAGILTIGAGVGNDFVGDVVVNGGGTLAVGSNNFLGNVSNTITIGSGSTLDLNGIGNGGNNFQAYDENTFILEGGATLTNSSGTVLNQAFSNQLQFGGDVTLSGSQRIDIFGNIDVTGTNITITLDYVQPTGNIGSVINGDNSSESIALWHVVEGTLFVNNAGSLGDSAVVRVEDGGVLRGNGGTAAGDWTTINDVFLEAGSQIQKRDQNNVFNLEGTVDVEGDTQINPGGPGDAIALNAVLTGAGNATFNNTGIVRLGTGFADTTFSGDVIIGDVGGNKILQLADLNVAVAETTTLSADVIIDETGPNLFDLQVVGAEDTMTLSGDISGSGGAGIQKTGLGKVILSGTNTYSGTTTATNGTLSITADDALPAGGDVTITAPGFLNLDYVGSITVGLLTIDGVVQPIGPVDMNHPSGAITGGGSLNVTVTDAPPAITAIAIDGSGNVLLTTSDPAAGLTTQRMDDETLGTFADIATASATGANEITIPAADVDPDANGTELYRVYYP